MFSVRVYLFGLLFSCFSVNCSSGIFISCDIALVKLLCWCVDEIVRYRAGMWFWWRGLGLFVSTLDVVKMWWLHRILYCSPLQCGFFLIHAMCCFLVCVRLIEALIFIVEFRHSCRIFACYDWVFGMSCSLWLFFWSTEATSYWIMVRIKLLYHWRGIALAWTMAVCLDYGSLEVIVSGGDGFWW